MENLVQVTLPSVEPITLDQAKLHCRCQHDLENSNFEGWIASAREYAETSTRKQLIYSTWRLELDSFPFTGVSRICTQQRSNAGSLLSLQIPIHISPVKTDSISIRYYDVAGVDTVLDPASYQIRANEDYCFMLPMPNCSWPETQYGRLDAVRVSLTAGYTENPVQLKQRCPQIIHAMLLIIGAGYTQRSQDIVIPKAVDDLLLKKTSVRYC